MRGGNKMLILSGAGSAAAPSGAPDTITGLEMWYKADAITGKVDGDSISQWNDSTANARHLTQATGGLQPVYRASALNGLAGVEFAADYLKTATLTAIPVPTTIVVVAKITGATSTYLLDGLGVSNRQGFFYDLTNVYVMNGAASAGTAYTRGNPDIFVGHCEATANLTRWWLNGAAQNTTNAGAPQSSIGFTVGAKYNNVNILTGFIYEICIYSGALSTADRDALESHLGAKWGITVV